MSCSIGEALAARLRPQPQPQLPQPQTTRTRFVLDDNQGGTEQSIRVFEEVGSYQNKINMAICT